MDIGNMIQTLAKTDKQLAKNLEYGKVISVDKDNLECKIQLLNTDTIIDEVSLSVNSNATSVEFPKVGSVVVLGWIDNFNAEVLHISEREKIITGNATQTLKAILDDFSDTQKKFAGDLIDAIKQSTYTTPSGTTSPAPINITAFETALNTYEQNLQTFLDNLSELYEK